MKKKSLAMVLAAAMCVTSLAGCGGKDEPDMSKYDKKESKEEKDERDDVNDEIPTGGEPDKEQFINTFTSEQPTTLDPSKGSDMYGSVILYNTVEPLVRIQDKKDEFNEIEYVNAGAEDYEVSDDGLVYTFHLREGNKWNDGEPVTAENYAYGIRRSADPDTACPYANLMFYIKNGQEINEGKKKLDELGVKVIDDKTLEITLEHPTPYFIDIVTQRTYFPQREDLAEKLGDKYSTDPDTLPQCGPFILKDWTMNTEQNFVKNDDYWDAKNVKLDKFHVAIIQEANTIYQALKSGEIDFAGVSDPKWKAQFFDDDNFYHISKTRADTVYLTTNYHENSNLKNNKMRQAISIALDRQELIDATMNGVPIPAYDFVPPAVSNLGEVFNVENKGCVSELAEDNKDPKALFIEGLKEAGLDEDPGKFELHYLGSGTSQDARLMGEFIQQNLKDVLGIKVKVDQMEWNQFMNAMQAGDYDVAHLAWNADYNDPSNFLETCYSKTAVYDNGFEDKKYDELLEKAQVEEDVAKRGELLHEAEHQLVYEDAAVIPINHRVSHSFIRKYIRNANISMFCTTGMRNMYTSGRK